MNLVLKTLLTVGLAAALGALVFQGRQAAVLREESHVLRLRQTNLATELARLRQQRADATNCLAEVERENARLKTDQLAAEVARLRLEAQRWREAARPFQAPWVRASTSRVARLKEQLALMPGTQIPEFRFLTPEDWLAAASTPLETEADYRRALAALRTAGEWVFAGHLHQALNAYRKTHPEGFPANMAELQPFFTLPVDEALLGRWRVAPAGELYGVGEHGSNWLLTQRAPVDEEYDACLVVGVDGDAENSFKYQRAMRTLLPVIEAIKQSGLSEEQLTIDGHPNSSVLRSFAKTPEQKDALEFLLRELGPPQ